MADRGLDTYREKRNFGRTAEPKGRRARRSAREPIFVVQKHEARALHFDFRLELDGVLLSWAVTKGPSLDPSDKRLAVRTEDHPLDYAEFEGTIPKGEYGGGTVMLWDRGTWHPDGDPHAGLEEGKLSFRLKGERMTGGWALIRMRGRKGEKRENWLLIKERDEAAGTDGVLVSEHVTSVASGRSMQEIAGSSPAKGNGARKDSGSNSSKETETKGRPGSKPGKSGAQSGSGRKRRSMPAFREPQLATLVDSVPEGDEWLHEMKFDGYRCLAAVAGGKARCYSRSGKDWTDKFADVADALAGLDCDSALLDGEVTTRDGGDEPSQFSALQQALSKGGALAYHAFDLLSLDGEELAGKPLLERKERLKALIDDLPGQAVRYSEHVQGHGAKVFASVCREGREGIVAKRADAPYRGARTRSWLKIKCTRRQELVVAGWSPSDRNRPFSSLLLGSYEDGKLRYRGRVGTGFSDAALQDIAGRLKKLARKTSPFDQVPRPVARTARWVAPELVAEIDFAELTADGYVRHGSFLGLREDKDAAAVTLERTQPMAGDEDTEVRGVRLTHPDRIVFKDQGVSKRDLAEYYAAVADRMLPHVENRLLSLVRCPAGSDDKCFFQKHAGQGFPSEIRQTEISETSGARKDYVYVEGPEGLIAAVQMGTLEFHIWGSRIDKLEKPDRLVFDLDPDEGMAFRHVLQAATELRDALDELGLRTLPLVTGGKGVHVVAPLRRTADWRRVKGFAKGIAQRFAAREPDRFTATMSKEKRKGRIFIDWLRNERGSTAIAPYSTRAKKGAPVAMPLAWDELEKLEAANLFSLDAARERMGRPDPWRAMADWSQSITAEMLDGLA